jgi:hypothetical protein
MTGISLKIGARELIPATEETENRTLSMLLWGVSGHGKTQLAETAPGDKLWLMFDPDGEAALKINSPRGRNHFIPMYKEKDDVVLQFKNADPLGIEKMLIEHPEIETVVFDSLTTFSEMSLSWGVVAARATPKGKGSTEEQPGYEGYNHKKVYCMHAFKNILRLCKRQNRHIIFIAHEDKPEKNDKGEFVGITLMLGSSLVVEVPVKISEVWHVTDIGNKGGVPQHRIAFRPSRGRSPMRSRMFETNGDPEFVTSYDALKNKGEGIAEWYTRWVAGNFEKIGVPK